MTQLDDATAPEPARIDAGPADNACRGLRFGLLGPMSATLDGAPVALGGRRQAAVVAVLLVARGDTVPADALIDAVWDGAPPPSAQTALQAYVSHLRRRLEPGRAARARAEVIVSRGLGYALHVPDDAVDARAFEAAVRQGAPQAEPAAAVRRLSRGLELWRGPALADYADEAWAQPEAQRLNELRGVAREQLVAARLACGEHAVLVPELEAMLSAEPLREELWRLLVLALYRSGRQADALGALRRARHRLAEELGVDPGPGLRALEAEVLAQSPALDAPRAQATDGAAMGAAVGAAYGVAAAETGVEAAPRHGAPEDLVDRERELDLLGRALGDVLAGQSSMVLIEGPAGIGKTRLLAETRKLAAAAGATVLSARGSQLEREFGFGAVRQLFEPAVADPARRERLLAGSAAAAGAVFDVSSTTTVPAEGAFAVLHGLYWLTVNLAAKGPVLLAVDDVQWCDTGSLRFLSYLLPRLEGLPVLVVATLRTGEPHAEAHLLAELSGDPATVAVRPVPLTETGVADLVRQRLGPGSDHAFVTACHRTTSGNPLLLRQLLRALEADRVRPDASHADTVRAIGSRAVSSLVLMRFARMQPANQAVARAVAVLGDGASLPMVASLADLPEIEAARAIAALARAEVLREDYPLGFVHPLVGDAVYRDLPLGERELQHERAARVLAAAGASPEQVAAHLLLVAHRGDDGVVRLLREAATRALERGAPESAAAYLTRALAEPPAPHERAEVLLELGRVETLRDGPAGVRHLTEAYRGLTDPTLRAEAAITLTRTLVFAGARGAATRVAREALRDLPPDLEDARMGLLALQRIGGYMHGLDISEYGGPDLPAVTGDGVGARALAADVAFELLVAGDERERAVELARFALEGGALQRVDMGLLWVVAALVLDMAEANSTQYWDQALADSYARGALFAVLGAHLWRGYRQWLDGELSEAYQSLLHCNDQNLLWGANTVGQPYSDAFMVGVLLDLGDLPRARAVLEQVRDQPRIGEGVRLFGQAEALVLMAEGRAAEALERLDAVRDTMSIIANPVWRPWRSLRARALALLGRLDEALALVDAELELCRRWGAPGLVGRTLRLRGELREEREAGSGVADLREAVSLLEPTTARLELARALAAHGAATLPEGGLAATQLRRALELAQLCGAVPLQEQVTRALRRAGLELPGAGDARLSLTSNERRVAAMAVEGVPQREIAQRLFVTPRTVEDTIAGVCERLGAGSLPELRAALASA